MNKHLRRILPLAALLLFVSCSVETAIELETPERGTAAATVRMAPLLRRYLADLAEMQGARVDETTGFFDTPALIEAFAASEGVDLVGILNPDPSTLQLMLGFPQVESIFPDELTPQGKQVIRRSRSAGLEELTISIDEKNVAAVVGIVPFGDDPVSQTVTGLFRSGGSVEELREMLIWVFEEYADQKTIAAMIDDSAVRLTVKVPGRIVSVDGGIPLGEDRAEFRIPLTRFLSLDPPIEYRLRYRP